VVAVRPAAESDSDHQVVGGQSTRCDGLVLRVVLTDDALDSYSISFAPDPPAAASRGRHPCALAGQPHIGYLRLDGRFRSGQAGVEVSGGVPLTSAAHRGSVWFNSGVRLAGTVTRSGSRAATFDVFHRAPRNRRRRSGHGERGDERAPPDKSRRTRLGTGLLRAESG
jgi:hypothetical protein